MIPLGVRDCAVGDRGQQRPLDPAHPMEEVTSMSLSMAPLLMHSEQVQIGPHASVTGRLKRVPFRDALLARGAPLPPLTRSPIRSDRRALCAIPPSARLLLNESDDLKWGCRRPAPGMSRSVVSADESQGIARRMSLVFLRHTIAAMSRALSSVPFHSSHCSMTQPPDRVRQRMQTLDRVRNRSRAP
jgi:hypothetical protein